MNRDGWRECKLGEVAEIINGYAFKSANFINAQSENTYPVIKIKNVANGDVNLNDVQYHHFEPFLEKYLVDTGDILIALTGNHPDTMSQIVGEISRYKLQEKALLNQRVAKIQPNSNILPDYLYYFLKTDDIHNYLANASSGSANQANISKGDVESIPVLLPSVYKQKSIASILSSLDDKIDLLHRQNKTLEAMAETLFRQWFVEETEKSWEEGVVSDFATHYKSSINPQLFPMDNYYHYSIPAYDQFKSPIFESGKSIQSNKYIVPKNCILFSKLNPHRDKRVWLLQKEVVENSICSTEFQVILPLDPEYLYFLYGWLSYGNNYNEISSGVGGTSGSHQRIDPGTIFNYHCPLVGKTYVKGYNESVKPIFEKRQQNQYQVNSLIKLREMVLPKLMSGEIRAKNSDWWI